jgi:hypothetical protein
MSWTTGLFLLLQSESAQIEFDWDGNYQGVQFAQARPRAWHLPLLDGPADSEVETTGQRLRLQYLRAVRPEGEFWSYSVDVKNTSSTLVALFELTGGEVEP